MVAGHGDEQGMAMERKIPGTVEGHLQGVVVAAEVAVEAPQGARAAELLEERLARLSLARGRRVDVVEAHHLRRLGAHVRRRKPEVGRQPPFVREVPGLDVAAVEVVVIRRAHQGRRRQVHRARAFVGSSEERDARGERTERHDVNVGPYAILVQPIFALIANVRCFEQRRKEGQSL